MLPNLLIVGAAKAGTTSLYHYLNQHPDVFMSSVKEPKFFSAEDKIFPHKGPGDVISDRNIIRDFTRYQCLFSENKGQKIIGEASTDYLYYAGVPNRIRRYINNPKIIIILRDPSDRAYSAHQYLVREFRETLTFEEAFQAEAKRKAMNWEYIWFYKSLGLYYSQVKRYHRIFQSDQLLVLTFEELVQHPRETMKTIFKFLEIDDSFVPDMSTKHNVSGTPRVRWLADSVRRPGTAKTIIKNLTPPPLRRVWKKIILSNYVKLPVNPNTHAMLKQYYREDILKLQELISRNLSNWLV